MDPARPGTLTQSQPDAGPSDHIAFKSTEQPAQEQVPSTMRDALAVFAGSATPRLIAAGILSLLAWRARSPFCAADLAGASATASVGVLSWLLHLLLDPGRHWRHLEADDVACCTVSGCVAAFWTLQEYLLHAKALHSDFDWFGADHVS